MYLSVQERNPGGRFNSIRKGTEKRPKKGPKVNLLQAYAWTPRKSPAYTVSGPFLLRKFQSWFNRTKSAPEKGTEKGPEIFGPFFNAIESPPRVPTYHTTYVTFIRQYLCISGPELRAAPNILKPTLLFSTLKLTFAAVPVGLESVALPAGALVHLVVDVEAELSTRNPSISAPAWKGSYHQD